MRRLNRIFARLYPKSWRDRYGAEFEALLEDIEADSRTSFDVLKGALMAQARAWNYVRLVAITTLAGALIAFGASFRWPKQYASSAVFAVQEFLLNTGQTGPTADAIRDVAFRAESRSSLATIIQRYGLYQEKPIAMSDALERMKQNISIKPESAGRFRIQFVYGDPARGERATADLAKDFLHAAVESRELFVLSIDMPQQEPVSPRRSIFLLVGLATGLAAGGLAAVMLKWEATRAIIAMAALGAIAGYGVLAWTPYVELARSYGFPSPGSYRSEAVLLVTSPQDRSALVTELAREQSLGPNPSIESAAPGAIRVSFADPNRRVAQRAVQEATRQLIEKRHFAVLDSASLPIRTPYETPEVFTCGGLLLGIGLGGLVRLVAALIF